MINLYICAYCLVLLFFIGGCSKQQDHPAAGKHSPVARSVEKTTRVLTTIAEQERPQDVKQPAMHAPVNQGQSAEFQAFFSESGGGTAYIAQTAGKVYVVHNDKAGKRYNEVGDVSFSPDGKRVAYGALADGTWRMVIDGVEGEGFETVGTPKFSPDGRHVAYQAMRAEKWFIVVDKVVNSGTRGNYSRLEFNGDSTLLVYIESPDTGGKERLVICDLQFNTLRSFDGVGLPMATNAERTRIAAVSSLADGKSVIQFNFGVTDGAKNGRRYDIVDNVSFGPDGVTLAYVAKRAGEYYLVLNEKEEKIPAGNLAGPPVIRPDAKAVGAIIAKIIPAVQHVEVNSAENAFFHESFAHGGKREKKYYEASYLVYSPSGSGHAYGARDKRGWVLVANGEEGPVFDRVVSPVFSTDGKKLAYRARKDGKRFVVIADINGKTIKQHPSYEQIFQPVFTSDGKSVAYGVKDGNKLIWKVEELGE